jgi:dihydrofolate synthase/folylpolyglutamate synthase
MNKITVMTAIQLLKKQGWKISEEAIKFGLHHVVDTTGLMGRWQQLREQPKVICDTAHNKEGLSIVLNQIERESYNNLHIVLGVVSDKDLGKILPLFPKNALYYFCKPNVPRGLDANLLAEGARKFKLKGKIYKSVKSAYAGALKNSEKDDFIYVGGSTFVVAEVL